MGLGTARRTWVKDYCMVGSSQCKPNSPRLCGHQEELNPRVLLKLVDDGEPLLDGGGAIQPPPRPPCHRPCSLKDVQHCRELTKDNELAGGDRTQHVPHDPAGDGEQACAAHIGAERGAQAYMTLLLSKNTLLGSCMSRQPSSTAMRCSSKSLYPSSRSAAPWSLCDAAP